MLGYARPLSLVIGLMATAPVTAQAQYRGYIDCSPRPHQANYGCRTPGYGHYPPAYGGYAPFVDEDVGPAFYRGRRGYPAYEEDYGYEPY